MAVARLAAARTAAPARVLRVCRWLFQVIVPCRVRRPSRRVSHTYGTLLAGRAAAVPCGAEPRLSTRGVRGPCRGPCWAAGGRPRGPPQRGPIAGLGIRGAAVDAVGVRGRVLR